MSDVLGLSGISRDGLAGCREPSAARTISPALAHAGAIGIQRPRKVSASVLYSWPKCVTCPLIGL